jgi:hypothetical protein
LLKIKGDIAKNPTPSPSPKREGSYIVEIELFVSSI